MMVIKMLFQDFFENSIFLLVKFSFSDTMQVGMLSKKIGRYLNIIESEEA